MRSTVSRLRVYQLCLRLLDAGALGFHFGLEQACRKTHQFLSAFDLVAHVHVHGGHPIASHFRTDDHFLPREDRPIQGKGARDLRSFDRSHRHRERSGGLRLLHRTGRRDAQIGSRQHKCGGARPE